LPQHSSARQRCTVVWRRCRASGLWVSFGERRLCRSLPAVGFGVHRPAGTQHSSDGDKPRARRIMEKAGVPVLSGTSSGTTDLREAQAVAAQVGFPVLLKAAAGGGGRGLRIARAPDELAAVFPVAREEGEAAFGNGAL